MKHLSDFSPDFFPFPKESSICISINQWSLLLILVKESKRSFHILLYSITAQMVNMFVLSCLLEK